MSRLHKLFAGLAALSLMTTSAASCSKGNSSSSDDSRRYIETDEFSADVNEETEENTDDDISGQTIVWLADYDLNPQNNQKRSVALSLFEDLYDGRVEFVRTGAQEKLDTLAVMILGGDEVDMFPYEWDAVPNGVMKEQYEPLDPYFDIMGVNDGLWDDMKDVIDMFEYNGSHYVMPYALSNPLLITYSRKLMKDEGLDDPYELYLSGKWDWNAMMKMMETFVSGAEDGRTRYGINGSFGEAVIRSSGHTVINYNGDTLTNNIGDPEIEKAVLFMQDIAAKNLYDRQWREYFPDDDSTLFFASSDWSLGKSNAKNPDKDIMIVPFPKSPDADKNYLCCDFSAKMLVKGSEKGRAVAAYIRCEKLAASQEEYGDIAKKAFVGEKNDISFVTGEQYDALQSYLNPENMSPVVDFGYGMGEKMYGDGDCTFDTRGVINKLSEAFLSGETSVDSWESLRDTCSEIIDKEIKKFN